MSPRDRTVFDGPAGGASAGERPPASGATPREIATRIGGPIDRAEITNPGADDLLKEQLLSPGARVGRFLILRHLGEGGMGLIFAARDEELDREVALKILRTREREGALGRKRMLREAKSLARLSHPNIVTIYEVGEFEGHVFIAMKLIEGRTLRGWLNIQRRAWRTIVAVFVAAARGLAAAHKAGIIHRDFKPTNVLVDRDGGVTVLDFGIAIAPDRREAGPLTLAGTIAGTPAYMSPEQLAGAPVDARTDQYAFCTALYEALVGERPSKGSTIEDRLRDLITLPPPVFPKGAKEPKWLQRAVLRGLAQDPDQRFPSMDALIDALDRDPRRGLWRGLMAGGAALALGAGGYGLAYQQAAPDPICEVGARELGDAWDDARRARVADALGRSEVAFADDTLARLTPLLDEFQRGWIVEREAACQANLRGDLPTDLYGRQLDCLRRRRLSFVALTERLASADAAAVEGAVQAALELPAPSTCADITALTAAIAPPADPAVADEVAALRERLEGARAALALHHLGEGLEVVSALAPRADELGYLPLQAEVEALRGRLLAARGEHAAAEAALARAIWRADEARDDETLAAAMAALIRELGNDGRPEEALRWQPHARALLGRLGGVSPEGAALGRELGWIHFQRGDAAEARRWLDEALALAERHRLPDDPLVLSIDTCLAALLALEGDLAGSLAITGRVLKHREETLGPRHPDVAATLAVIAGAHRRGGDDKSALPFAVRALEIQEAALGPEDPALVPYVISVAEIRTRLGQEAAARPLLERAVTLEEARRGPDHPIVGDRLQALASLLVDLGDRPAARRAAERALAIREAALGRGAIPVAESLLLVARLDLADERQKPAIRGAERGLTIVSAHFDPPRLLQAQLQHVLADALRESRGGRKRANELATAALAGYRAIDADAHAAAIAEIEAWLDPPAPKRGKKTKKKRGKKGR
ncbi:MAG: serine/threonine protein kinase [Myxococcales bacterium]|nr:serine/threonine protein kinase [Myxococcales bacterium]